MMIRANTPHVGREGFAAMLTTLAILNRTGEILADRSGEILFHAESTNGNSYDFFDVLARKGCIYAEVDRQYIGYPPEWPNCKGYFVSTFPVKGLNEEISKFGVEEASEMVANFMMQESILDI